MHLESGAIHRHHQNVSMPFKLTLEFAPGWSNNMLTREQLVGKLFVSFAGLIHVCNVIIGGFQEKFFRPGSHSFKLDYLHAF